MRRRFHGFFRLKPEATLLLIVLTAACGGSSPPTPPTAEPASAPAPHSGPQLMAGRGNHHHPITTTSTEAQQFFDQGVTLAYAFNHEEAVRSFQRAAALDPKAAMPHWGIAWALGPNYNLDVDDPRAKKASEAIAAAQALAAGGSALEREYVEVMASRYSKEPNADRAALARAYSRAAGALMRRHPDDMDAATLYAESLMNLRPWKLWTLDGRPAEDTNEIVAVLESVLRRAPDHIGANHYYIHTVEASPNPARALASAKRLETLVPMAGHLVHMPAHIYARTGDQAAAARANLAGAEADRVYLKAAPQESFYAMAYYPHNLHFLADSHMMQGRFADAQKAAAEVADRLAPHAGMMPMIESMIVMPTSVLLRFGRDGDILKLPQPAADRPVQTAWWRFARGVALARTGKADDAARERTALSEAIARVPDSALFGGTGLEPAQSVLAVAGLALDARIASARRLHDQSIAFWTKAVIAGDRIAYDEPPVWFYPLRESLGAELLRAGKAAEAERVFREDLTRNPRNARSLFGLRASLAAQGKDADAALVEREFDAAWKNADTALTLEGL